ncbi:ATP-dependent RNA helicase [Schizosaccharomyces japonicus yFS275]|uniref:RNA helicase n=1 Tax=Schizosaccharomyces japonicus (strain yFS275 / FY16936) TaxID=402676 RepID=B6K0W8_SCHJY|nr:ATP-dependent RNA helicase [Schizosaccharomyces japonicus yFS275]EEB07589.1 ATP-dependent RNA helicase [Schizosaccharomyces japonicus yFS275]
MNQNESLITSNSFSNLSIKRIRELLPIARFRRELLYLIENHQVTVVIGSTGCGKSTQLTQYLYESGWAESGKCIACTEPRKVVVKSLAQRVAEEMGCTLGEECGYGMSFESCTSKTTKVKYITDGLLLQEMFIDPLLTQYSVIMLDEVHERTIATDLLLCLLKKILKQRSDLRIIVASATLDAEKLEEYFKVDQLSCTTFHLESRLFPVDVFYLSTPTENYLENAIEVCSSINKTAPADDDILVFLSGRAEIDECVKRLETASLRNIGSAPQMVALPLYSGLTLDEQMRVFQKVEQGSRKVVFATNIAEASISVEGITYVIDCGYEKVRVYNPYNRSTALVKTSISQASADQRAGRAGRTKPGKCFRLYTEAAFSALKAKSSPELTHSDLIQPLLFLKAMGIKNIVNLSFLDNPPTVQFMAALEELYFLGALDEMGHLTRPLGYSMAEFPLHPRLSKTLLTAAKFGCVQEVLNICSILTITTNLFIKRSSAEYFNSFYKFAVEEGDLLTQLNAFHAYLKQKRESRWCSNHCLNAQSLLQAEQVQQRLQQYLRKFGVYATSRKPTDKTNILKCFLASHYSYVAKRQRNGSYKTPEGLNVYIDKDSVLHEQTPTWIMYYEAETIGEKTYAKVVSVIEGAWLRDYYDEKKNTTGAA